jgi:hypothetical protein
MEMEFLRASTTPWPGLRKGVAIAPIDPLFPSPMIAVPVTFAGLNVTLPIMD